jgi:hypothetical protein
MTSTELKAQIDSQITNETSANAITPTDVGTNLKDIVDYVDQEDDLREVLTNKSTNVTTDGASDTKYPSVKAVKDYVDANTGGSNYISYVANVDYNSVNNVFIDEIGFSSVVVTNPSNGQIVFTKTGVFAGVDVNKICFLSQNLSNSGQVFVTLLSQGGPFEENPNDKMTLNIFDMTGGQTGTPSGNVIIEVRIYN